MVAYIDDLQWADQASIALWGRLARSARQVPLLLVGIMRPAPQRDDLLALRRVAVDAARLQLTGLTGAAAADLVATLAGGKPDGNLLRLADGAAGNPLYLTELVAALARSASLTVTEAGAAEVASGSAPGSLSAAIADRLGFMAGPVREVLRAAALLGAEFAVPDLAIVLGRSVADLIPAVDEAEGRRFVDELGPAVVVAPLGLLASGAISHFAQGGGAAPGEKHILLLLGTSEEEGRELPDNVCFLAVDDAARAGGDAGHRGAARQRMSMAPIRAEAPVAVLH